MHWMLAFVVLALNIYQVLQLSAFLLIVVNVLLADVWKGLVLDENKTTK